MKAILAYHRLYKCTLARVQWLESYSIHMYMVSGPIVGGIHFFLRKSMCDDTQRLKSIKKVIKNSRSNMISYSLHFLTSRHLLGSSKYTVHRMIVSSGQIRPEIE